MAFKGQVIRVPAPRRPKWHKRQQPTDTPRQMYLHLGGGKTITFDNLEQLKRFAQERGWRPK